MKLFLFVFFSYFVIAEADVFPCPNGFIQFDPPQNLADTVYYPYNYYRSPAALFPDNYECKYQINVPQGLWAYAEISITTTENSGSSPPPVIVTDKLNRSESLTYGDKEVFYFINNGGSILLSTGMTNATFKFGVHWNKNPSTFNPSKIELNIADTEPKVFDSTSNSLTVFTAESKVSVVVIPPMLPVNIYVLRGIMFYDGPDWNSTYVGSAMQFYQSGNQWISNGSKLTVQYLTGYSSLDGYVVLQEYENTKRIAQYQGAACEITADNCETKLQTSSGSSAVITYFPEGFFSNDFGESISSLEGNGTLEVYIGGVTNSTKNLIATYDVKNSGKFFPQRFNGDIRTYVLSGDKTKLKINFNRDEYYPLVKSPGDKGFISSNHYLQSNKNQVALEKIKIGSNQLATFSFVVKTADITKNSSCLIRVTNGNDVAFIENYNATNLPTIGTTVQVVGDTFQVDFTSNSDVSKGLYIDYEILKNSSNYCFMISVFITLIFYF